MVELDGQMFLILLRIKQKTLCLIGKVMANPDRNLCKNALKHGVGEDNGKNLTRTMNISDVTERKHNKNIIKQPILK